MALETESGFMSAPTLSTVRDELGFSSMRLIYESKSGRFQVFLARHFGRQVVLKCPGAGFDKDSHVIAQLYKEFCIGFSIEHPGVCRSLSLSTLPNGVPALEMEYCPGISLRNMIDYRTPKLGAKQTEAAVTAVLKALESIHRAEVVHRDIKPDNIMVDPCTGGIKIIDFGCADSPEYILLKGPAGTRRYQQEVKNGRRPVPTDDLYALGLTLAEMSAIVDDRAVQSRVQALSSELTHGRFATATEALGWWSRSARMRNSMRLLGKVAAVAAILIVAVGLWFGFARSTSPAAEDFQDMTSDVNCYPIDSQSNTPPPFIARHKC
ncbi:MAG: protein kinase [Bacteroidales bacterium]|nr:protein kinase [Bacteroidales bacterium]